MLIELAAANAAYAVIKETIGNGRDLMDAASALSQWFDSKDSLQKKANAKGGANRSDLEEFAALEKIREQEAELKTMMIYQGRGGLWTDWLKFQSEAKRKREAAEREAVLKRQRFIDRLKDGGMILLMVVLVGGLGAIIGFAIWMSRDV